MLTKTLARSGLMHSAIFAHANQSKGSDRHSAKHTPQYASGLWYLQTSAGACGATCKSEGNQCCLDTCKDRR